VRLPITFGEQINNKSLSRVRITIFALIQGDGQCL
jgi:hypothetical protein